MRLTFEFSKETKGAVQYHEIEGSDPLGEPIVGTLYVRKSGLRKLGASTIPKQVTIDLEVGS